MSMLKLRPNVAAIIRNAQGQIMVAERTDSAGAWLLPQGGVDQAETPEQSLERELMEEVSLSREDYRVVERRGPYSYIFRNGRKKRGFDGQIQEYFLLDLLAAESAINVNTEHREFRRVQWIEPAKFQLNWLPPMKKEVYRAVFQDFFGIVLESEKENGR